MLPLSLLEALRRHDTPPEVLEDEDFTSSLPRRFGLSDVVLLQIRRYEDAMKRGHDVPVAEVLDLMRLVLRRPDAATILREAGASVARRHFQRFRRPTAFNIAGRGLPGAFVFIAIRRTSRRLLNRVLGRGTLELVGRPLTVRIRHPFTVQAGGDGTACLLFSGVLEELVFLYTRRRERIVHSSCESWGHPACEWSLVTDS